MTDENTKRIIEIEGVKVEVDLRQAKQIETLKVGDAVKVLTKTYSGHEVSHGVLVGFDNFPNLPTMLIAYVNQTYSKAELKMLAYNADTKETQVIAANADDISFDREQVLKWFDREDARLDREKQEIAAQREYFLKHFGSVFGEAEAEEV